MGKFSATIFLIALGLVVEVDPQTWARPDGFGRSYGFRPNEIDVQVGKKQVEPWGLYQSDRTQEQLEQEEDELLKLLVDNSVDIDYVKWDSVGDRVIAKTNVSEEAKRVVRQVKKQRPGFFWTLFRVTFETVNETRAAIQQINDIVTKTILPESATSKAPLKSVTPSASADVNITDMSNMTTTEAPFKLTRNTLLSIIRRNVRGLVRLFNIEWKDAIDQSQISVREFQKGLGKSVRPYLADNPAAY